MEKRKASVPKVLLNVVPIQWEDTIGLHLYRQILHRTGARCLLCVTRRKLQAPAVCTLYIHAVPGVDAHGSYKTVKGRSHICKLQKSEREMPQHV